VSDKEGGWWAFGLGGASFGIFMMMVPIKILTTLVMAVGATCIWVVMYWLARIFINRKTLTKKRYWSGSYLTNLVSGFSSA
jgi:hypothetical protein